MPHFTKIHRNLSLPLLRHLSRIRSSGILWLGLCFCNHESWTYFARPHWTVDSPWKGRCLRRTPYRKWRRPLFVLWRGCKLTTAVFEHTNTHVYKFAQIIYSIISTIFWKLVLFEVSFYFIVVTTRNNNHNISDRILRLAAPTTRAKPVPTLKRVPCFIA